MTSYDKLTNTQKNFINALCDLLAESDNKNTSESAELTSTTSIESTSDKLVLGKKGKSYVFNYDAIKKLVDSGISKVEIARLAGVSQFCIHTYLEKSGLCETKHRVTKVDSSESSIIESNDIKSTSTPKAVVKRDKFKSKKSIEEIRDSTPDSLKKDDIAVCPICHRRFIPATYHIYKIGSKAYCSYTCARKAGWNK